MRELSILWEFSQSLASVTLDSLWPQSIGLSKRLIGPEYWISGLCRMREVRSVGHTVMIGWYQILGSISSRAWCTTVWLELILRVRLGFLIVDVRCCMSIFYAYHLHLFDDKHVIYAPGSSKSRDRFKCTVS